jgi:hypothetical protein
MGIIQRLQLHSIKLFSLASVYISDEVALHHSERLLVLLWLQPEINNWAVFCLLSYVLLALLDVLG